MPPANETDEYGAAVAYVIATQKCSTSQIQRKLGIGYNKASRLIEQMETAGIVSASDHVGRRTVLSTKEKEATVTKLKTSHDEQRAKSGRPPMKADPIDDRRADNTFRVTADELRQFVERLERLAADKQDISEQQKEVKAEAKGRGYDVKVIGKIIALCKREAHEVAEEEAVMDMYKDALGMV